VEADRANVSGLHSAGGWPPPRPPNPASAWGVVAVNGRPLVHLRVECAEVCAAAARCAGVEDP
jgi:hypothetical protein